MSAWDRESGDESVPGGTGVGGAGLGRRRGRPSVGRLLGEGEDPLAWSVALPRLGSLRLRVHVVFLLVAASELILASADDRIGPVHVATALLSLLALVLAREVGRWVILRAMESDPAPIVLWPLGSLSPVRPPGGWRRELVASAGGVTVNMLLWPVLAGVLYSRGLGWDSIVFNPFVPSAVLSGIGSPTTIVVWWLYYINAILVALHVGLPMQPLDAGRMVEAVLRSKLGIRAATWAAARTGLVTAAVVFVAAMSAGHTRLMGLAVFGAVVSWLQIRRTQFAVDPTVPNPSFEHESANAYSAVGMEFFEAKDDVLAELAHEKNDEGEPIDELEAEPDVGVADAALSRTQFAAKGATNPTDDGAALDAVLGKISRSGIASLSEDERRVLDEATRRRRGS